jgi:hypothetical protein
METITFECPACKQVLKVGADKAGRKAKCATCGTVTTIPAIQAGPPQAIPVSPPEPHEAVYDEDRAPRRSARRPEEDEDDRPRRRSRVNEEDDEEVPRRRRSRDDDDEEDDYDRDAAARRGPPYPVVVKMAGIVWIVFGSIIVLRTLIVLALVMAASAPAGGPVGGGAPRGAVISGAVCLVVFVGLIAAAFIFVGVQSVRGTAPGTVGNGIGSIVFGALNLFSVVTAVLAKSYVDAGLSFLFVAALIGAGVLALVGTSAYQEWRYFYKPRKRRRRSRGH